MLGDHRRLQSRHLETCILAPRSLSANPSIHIWVPAMCARQYRQRMIEWARADAIVMPSAL